MNVIVPYICKRKLKVMKEKILRFTYLLNGRRESKDWVSVFSLCLLFILFPALGLISIMFGAIGDKRQIRFGVLAITCGVLFPLLDAYISWVVALLASIFTGVFIESLLSKFKPIKMPKWSLIKKEENYEIEN